jgi:hypothetical protein
LLKAEKRGVKTLIINAFNYFQKISKRYFVVQEMCLHLQPQKSEDSSLKY